MFARKTWVQILSNEANQREKEVSIQVPSFRSQSKTALALHYDSIIDVQDMRPHYR